MPAQMHTLALPIISQLSLCSRIMLGFIVAPHPATCFLVWTICVAVVCLRQSGRYSPAAHAQLRADIRMRTRCIITAYT